MIAGKKTLCKWASPLLALSMLLLAVMAGLPEKSRAAISEEEAHSIGVDAYLYFYPLISMDLTRKQSTNVEPGKEAGHGPMNMFANVPEYPPANMKLVVRLNFDTLYSRNVAGYHQRAGDRFRPRYGRSLLPPSDARHVDRRVRIHWMAYHWNSSGYLPRGSPRLAARSQRSAH